MTEPKATDQVLGEIMTEMKRLTQHVKDAARRVDETLVRMHDIEAQLLQVDSRIEVLEGKCHGLSVRPTQRNCIHCGRIIRGVQNRCDVCGKEQ